MPSLLRSLPGDLGVVRPRRAGCAARFQLLSVFVILLVVLYHVENVYVVLLSYGLINLTTSDSGQICAQNRAVESAQATTSAVRSGLSEPRLFRDTTGTTSKSRFASNGFFRMCF